MFLEYSELLNAFDSDAAYKITIIVKKLDKDEFKKAILIPPKGDDLDKYRAEYNKILLDEATGSNGFVQQKYITVSVHKKSVEEARNFFSRTGTDLTAHFNRLGSRAIVLDAGDRLRLLHDFFRPGEDGGYHFNAADAMQKGHSFKDSICPDTFEFEKDHFVMGDKYGRVVFLRDYANFIKDDLVSKRNAYPTGLTQNVEYLLDSITARTMLSNSEFIVMNNQATSDRAELAKLLNISSEQLDYVTNADAGCGLMRIGNAIVPFVNKFPKGALYNLMTTKPGDRECQ